MKGYSDDKVRKVAMHRDCIEMADYDDFIRRSEASNIAADFYRNGRKRSVYHVKDGMLNGPFEEYFPDETVSKRGFYINDMKYGDFEEFYPNHLLRSKYHYFYDILDGDFEECFSTGGISQKGSFWNGKLDGKYVKYRKNGQVELEIDYVDGKKDGEYKEFSIHGLPVVIAHFKEDMLHGRCERYRANGQLGWVENYDYDRLISYSCAGLSWMLQNQNQRS